MIDEENPWTYGVYHLEQQRKRYNSLNIETIQPRTCFPYRDCVWLNIWYRIFQLFQSSKRRDPHFRFSNIPGQADVLMCIWLHKKQPPWNRSLKGWCFYTAGGNFRHDLISIHRFGSWKGRLLGSRSSDRYQLILATQQWVSIGGGRTYHRNPRAYRIRLIPQPASYESSPDTKHKKTRKTKQERNQEETQHFIGNSTSILHRFI